MAGLSELLGKLDTDNQVRGRQFERICKWYLHNDPKYRLQLNRVWLRSEWPERWGPDAGIDLVAQTHDKALWAVQAKAYAPTHHITKADLDTFLSESSREVFSYRLLIATTNFIGSTAERTLHAQEKPVGTVLLSDLEKSQLVWPDSPERLEAKPLEPKKPLPHQEKAVSDVCKGFMEKDRGQLIMACGTGKTLTSLWIAEELQDQRVLILVPTLTLLAQTLREWTQNTCHSFHYLPVCSDDTVRGADRLIARTSDLGLPVTTDPREVVEFLLKPGRRVVFSTYQSSPVIAKAFTDDTIPPFDIAIADEAHRCAGPSLATFATILDSAAIRAKHRLFMTATPIYFTGRIHKEATEVDYEIASMDDKEKFGPVFHRLSFSEAIRRDLLSDYQVLIIGVDNSTYRNYAENGMFVTTDGKYVTDARTLASHIVIAKAMQQYNLHRIISFHSRIRRAKEFSEELLEVLRWMPEKSRPEGDFWSAHVSGEMSSGKRDALLDRFRHLEEKERGLLANARCLGEGIDVPALDGVAFIDPKSSQLDIVQAVGRAIRKTKDKRIGTVIVPVFVGPEQDHKPVLESSTFKSVWNVLKALRAHDDVLSIALDKLRRQLGQRGNKEFILPDKLIIDMPLAIGRDFAESFHVKVVERSTSSWDFFFGLLCQYIERKGHTLVPKQYVTKDGYKLGQWVASQRHSHKRRQLSAEREERLQQLSGWVWDASEARWQEGFSHLRTYAKREGNTQVPSSYFTEEDYNLGNWVQTQRSAHRKGKLSIERKKALESLSTWEWGTARDEDKWQIGFERLRQYTKREGHANVPVSYVTPDGYYLERWVKAQRSAYKRGELSVQRRQALESLPAWVWGKARDEDKSHTGFRHVGEARGEAKWQIGYKHLREYAEREGHTNVPVSYVTPDDYNLGNWVQSQRSAHRKGKLSIDRQKALESLSAWEWGKEKGEDKWQAGFKHLRAYTKREGHANVPVNYVTSKGFNLGRWVRSQRSKYSTGILDSKQQRALENLSGWIWNAQEAIWFDHFKRLQRYVELEGHAAVPRRYVEKDGFKLGLWVMSQRERYRQKKLPLRFRKTLEIVPGWTWNPRKDKRVLTSAWQKGFHHLRRFVHDNGHANVPGKHVARDGYKLGVWVSNERSKYRREGLAQDRIQALEKLPGWTWAVRKTSDRPKE